MLPKATLLVLMAVSLAACAGMPIYSAAPIEARVVDAETDEPIKDANVIAAWRLIAKSWDGPRHAGYLEVMETVTSGNGQFSFPGFTKANSTPGELRNEDPEVLIFKAGYKAERVTNHYAGYTSASPGPQRVAGVHGKTVKLAKLKMDYSNKNARWYASVDTPVSMIIEDCEWKKIPLAILAMDRERKRIKKINHLFDTALPSIESVERHKSSCGSAIEFFREYAK